MAMTTTSQPKAWLPEQVGDLVVVPVTAASVAMQATRVSTASDRVDSYAVPIVTADPSAAFVAEGAEIPTSDIELGEDRDIFHKIAGLTVISREMADDSSPDVAQQIGQGLARDIARRIDEAFFGTRASATLPFRGLGDITGVTEVAAAAWKNGDPFTEAVYRAQEVGAQVGAFVTNPGTALALAQLKEGTASNRDLLQPDPTSPTVRRIAGVPLLVSPAVAEGVVWGLPNDGRVLLVIRKDVDLRRDESRFFTSDQVAIRATLRITSLFGHSASIVKIQGPTGS